MKTLFLGVLLSMGMMAHAQYTYFNRSYFEQSQDTLIAVSYFVDTIQSGYFTFSTSSVNNQLGYASINYTASGSIQNISINSQQTLGWGISGQWNNGILRLGEGALISVQTGATDCGGSVPYLFQMNMEADFIWSHLFTEWIECEPFVQVDPIGLCTYSDTTFLMTCRYRPDQDNNLTQLRFTVFDFLGNQMSDVFSSGDEWHYFNLASVSRKNDFLIVGGNGNICNTYDIQVVKTDLQGNVIQSNCFGNQEWQQSEPICGGVLDTEGNQVIMYSRCENYQWVGEIEAKLHVLKVDSDDLSAIYDNPIDFDVFDNGLISTGAIFTAVKEVPQGGYVGTFYYYEPTYQYIHAGILKVTYDGQLDWVKLYSPPNDFEFNALYDITPTPDGGFAATGISSNNLTQKHWLLKIDSCGYEQPSGCPAVINVEEQRDTKVQLWPNPFHNLLKAVLPQDANRVFISDMTGRIVFEEKVFYPNQQFDLSRIEKGAYLLNVVCEDGRIIGQRIVKQ